MNLSEVIVILILLSSLGATLVVPRIEDPFMDEWFRSDVLHTQTLAMAYHQTLHLDDHWGIDVWFNANGNINQPQRLEFVNHTVVLRLGTGRFDVPRLSDD